MAKSSSPARRVNRSILMVFIVLAVGSGASAWFAASSSTTSSPTTTLEPIVSHMGTGLQPAETILSWFDHSMRVEQFDYEMPALSCDAMNQELSTDLCAVARSSSGDFMLVGTESFWDPTEKDSSGFAKIPLALTAYSLRTGNGATRAVSVLDGSTEKAFTQVKVTIDISVTKVDGNDVLILHKHLADIKADAYSYWDSVQILSASSTGAPTVVGSYEGARMSVQSTGKSLILSALRYRSPNKMNQGDDWTSNITLSPSDRDPYSWDEIITSGSRQAKGDVRVKVLSSYTFPVSRISPSTSAANA